MDKGDDKSRGKHAPIEIRPYPRIGASLTVYENSLYLFGGHDASNEKLDDFWKYDLKENKWTLLTTTGTKPIGRNGHTTVIINNKLVLFGGIIEVTKESDEIFVYDFAT